MFRFLVLLNYFWLSRDPDETAKLYCDQHCFKIHSELIMSIWDAVLYHAPALEKLADDENVPYSYRRRSHAKKRKEVAPSICLARLVIWKLFDKSY